MHLMNNSKASPSDSTTLNPIFFLLRIIPHYRLPVLEGLLEKNKQVIIYYGQKTKSGLIDNGKIPKNVHYKQIRNYYLYGEQFFFSSIYSHIFRYKPSIVVTVFNIGNLNLYFLFFLRIFLKFKIVLWSFGYDPLKGFSPRERFIDKIRLYLYQKSDAVIFYWEKGKEVVSSFSKRTSHYFVAPNTIDTNRLFAIRQEIEGRPISELKKELQITESVHFVYVGRLIKDKQVDFLIRAFHDLRNMNQDARLTIIGKGPEYQNLQALIRQLGVQNVYFSGEILDPVEVGKWIYISDAFVMPGRLGNSVVHSFCFGTPVISQKKGYFYHGEGIGYMKDGINGFLANDGDIHDFAERMHLISTNTKLREEMKMNCIQTVHSECSIDKMVEGIMQALDYASRTKRNN